MSCCYGRTSRNENSRSCWSAGSRGQSANCCGQFDSAGRGEPCWTASQIATILAASEQSGGCTCARPVYLTVPAFLYGNTQSSDNDGCYTICLG